MRGRGGRRAARRVDGFSLLEVMVSAVLLVIVFFGLAQFHARGRTQLDYEEDRRKATAVAQACLDGIRRDYRYDQLPALDATVQSLVVDSRTYTVTHGVSAASPEPQATTVTVVVRWVAKVADTDVTRTLSATTILGRGMP